MEAIYNQSEGVMPGQTMQARVHKAGSGTTYFYFSDVSARRAAELAAASCSAQCIALDYIEIIDDGYDYDSPGILVADWQGRPAITINTEF